MRYLVDEVEGVEGPSIRQLLGLYAGLLAEDLVTDLFSVAANVRTLSKHEFVGHDSHCEIVSSVWVVFTAKDLRRHVARSTACILVILLFELSADAEISDTEVPLGIEHYVFRFDIAMDYLTSVKVFEGYDEISEEELGLDLRESASASDMITEVSAVDVVHDEIDVLSVLKGVSHIDEKGVSDAR
jgi:hypothetical protein